MRFNIKEVIKRGTVIASALVLSLCNGISLYVDAEEATTEANNSNTLSRSMIEYFRTKNAVDESYISNDEMRVFGAFLSNFYRPFKTNLNELSTNVEEDSVYDKVINVFFGGDTSQETTLKMVLNKVEQGVINNSEDLYVDENCTTYATLTNYFANKGAFTLYRNNGTVVFGGDAVGTNTIKYISMQADIASTQEYIKNKGSKAKSVALKVTPFGDIIMEDGVVVVPACLNPYTFYKTSDKNTVEKKRLPLNNAFVMGNLVGSDDLTKGSITYSAASNRTANYIGIGYGMGATSETEDASLLRWMEYQKSGTCKTKCNKIANSKLSIVAGKVPSLNKEAGEVSYSDDILISISSKALSGFDTGENGFFTGELEGALKSICCDDVLKEGEVIDTVGNFANESAWSSSDNGISVYSLFGDGNETVSEWEKLLKTDSELGKGLKNLYTSGKINYWTFADSEIFEKTSDYTGSTTNFGEVEEYNNWLVYGSQLYSNNGGGKSRFKKDDGGEWIAKASREYTGIIISEDDDMGLKGDVANFYDLMKNGAWRIVAPSSSFTNALSNKTTKWSDNSIDIADKLNVWGGIYWAYFYEILGISTDSEGNMTSGTYTTSGNLPDLDIGLRYSGFNLADMLSGVDPVESAENELEKMQEDVLRKVYALLGTSHSEYRDNWVRSMVNDTVLSIHNSIIGSDFTGSIMKVGTGNSNSTYTGVMGYVTTPKLAELPFTSWLISNYTTIYLVLMTVIALMLILMWIAKQKKFGELVALFVIMAFVMLLPKTFIDGMIGVTNLASEKLYNDRFLFWALAQHQQSDDELVEATQDGTVSLALMSDLQDVENVTSDTGIRVKWMSPKKESKLNTLLGNKMNNELTTNTTIFRWLFSGVMQQETYVDDPLATYVYRPYNDIVKIAEDLSSTLASADKVTSYAGEDINKKINSNISGKIGSINKGEDGEKTERTSLSGNGEFMKLMYGSNGNTYAMTDEYDEVRGKSSSYSYITELFHSDDVNIAMFNSELVEDNSKQVGLDVDSLSGDALEKANVYLLYSESPYYYFYNVFSQAKADIQTGEDEYTTIQVNGSNGDSDVNDFAHILISKDFFKVTNDNIKNDTEYKEQAGYVRDFLNLEGLFTYVIPYLNYGNEYVHLWTDKFGADISDIDYDIEKYKDAVAESEMIKRDKIHNDCLGKVWNLYSPWVDTIYDTDVFNERIKTMAYDIKISDTVNPASYLEDGVERPMSFSPADMHAKNLNDSELTNIEYKINQTLEDTYEDLMYLNNYQGFDDEVLISAAAMIATFNFNKNFSSDNLIGENFTLYPQSFEMKNMNYDAFLRMIIMNSTGEPLSSSDGSVYVRMLNKSSLFTSIFLIINDALSVYVIPAAKILLLFTLMFLALIMIMYCIIAPKEEIFKTIMKTLVMPVVLFGVVLIGMSVVISLFVGEGMTDIVGSRGVSVVTNDPAITLLLLMLVNVVFIILLWKILKSVFMSVKKYAPAFGLAAAGVVVGAAGAVASRGAGIFKRGVDQTIGASGKARRDRRARKEYQDKMVELQEYNNFMTEVQWRRAMENETQEVRENARENARADMEEDRIEPRTSAEERKELEEINNKSSSMEKPNSKRRNTDNSAFLDAWESAEKDVYKSQEDGKGNEG